jgi:hypothetical protein
MLANPNMGNPKDLLGFAVLKPTYKKSLTYLISFLKLEKGEHLQSPP